MTWDERLAAIDWARIEGDLDGRGFACLGPLLDAPECASLRALYADDARFRSRVVMAKHGFGRGEYKYFDRPLPDVVAGLRARAYAPLASIASRWGERLRGGRAYPSELAALHEECRTHGQTRPTPLLLRYGEGDYNCLHQDLYGDVVFPLQIAVLLSEPGKDFDGGEFALVEQRPRMQSRVEVVPLRRGDAVLFAVRERPMDGARGTYRVAMRHGVSRLRRGERFTLGIIFHDAR